MRERKAGVCLLQWVVNQIGNLLSIEVVLTVICLVRALLRLGAVEVLLRFVDNLNVKVDLVEMWKEIVHMEEV